MALPFRDIFPALRQNIHGKPLAYLDSAASALKPQSVIDALNRFYTEYSANVHRGIHTLSEQATEAYEHARETVAAHINARHQEIVFTSGTTEGLNGVARMLEPFFAPGDEILLTELEHHSNIVPWQMVAARTGAVVKWVPIQPDGAISPEAVISAVTEKTVVIAITALSNALGTAPDIRKIREGTRNHDLYIVVDAAQAVVHSQIDVRALDCDFLAFSGHKLYGPNGVGVLYVRKAVGEKLGSWKGGGGMISEVTTDGFTPARPPLKFEAGTPPIGPAIGLAAAIDVVNSIGYEAIQKHERLLTAYTLSELKKISEVTLYGPADSNTQHSIVSFNVQNIHAHDVAAILDSHGVAIRAGHHCCQPLMHRLRIAGTARVSLAIYNTEEDIDALVNGIKKTISVFH